MYYLSDNDVDPPSAPGLFEGPVFIRYLACLILLFLTLPAYAKSDLHALENHFANSYGLDRAKTAAKIALTLRQADADRALHYAQVALEQLKTTSHVATEANVINTIAVAHLQKREYDATINYAKQALQLAEQFNLPLEEARTLNTLGALNWYRGDLDRAKDLFEASLALRKQHKVYAELSPALNNLGVIEEIQGRYNKAIEFYLQAIDYAEQIGSDEQLARPITNLGVLNQMLRNFDKALLFYQRSLVLKLKAGNLVGAAIAHNNISEIQIEKGEYQEAINSLQSGLNLLDKIEAPQEEALLLVNSGSAYLRLNDPDKAFEFFAQTRDLASRFSASEIDIYLAQGYARAYLQKGQLDQALENAQNFLTLAQEKQDRKSIKKAQHLHYRIYKEKQLYARALSAHEEFHRLHDELANKESTNYVARLQAEFETEKKEKELAVLQRQNALQEINIKRQEFIRNLVAVLSVCSLLVGFFVYRMRTIRVKAAVLERKVAERTRDIQQKNSAIAELLIQKEQLLDKKNLLFSTVSHELRTPLTLITGPLKQLIKSTHSKQTKSVLNSIHRNAARLCRMVDQLLDLARLDIQAESIGEPVDVGAAIEFLVASMEALFQGHQITRSIKTEKDIWIEMAPEALEKVIVNLVSNAIKYTSSGGKISVTAEARNDTIVISISDTGIGIAQDQHQRIFERFTRLENPLSKPVPGAGIGLALVKELTERYHGKIELTSEVNQGSTFTLIFPATTPTAATRQKYLRSTACENELAVQLPVTHAPLEVPDFTADTSARPTPPPARASTVLIVEDNDEVRTFIGNHLNSYYHCLYAEDGKQGVSLAIKEVPDLIISDLMMPHVSGLELAATLKEEQLTSHIPVIILTAKGDSETRYTAWRKNVDEYIEKPFDADELILRCENILSIRRLLTQRFRPEELVIEDPENRSKEKMDIAPVCFSPRDREFLDKLYCYLEKNHFESGLNASLISKALNITEKQLQRKIKALTNETIPACVRNFRLKKGAEKLTAGASITSVAYDVGFSSPSYFSTAFAARYGCSPSDYQLEKRKLTKETVKKAKAGASAG
ncbi:tetratricopeptide repeat protein [Exilibacterium tricleocarpae]|uniref:histidine kinase n=1 Tax=Exilibacterium tricleocarpae TaxID=2591008 RepID=A0A545TBA6_9GAMM|nr:tetratricopeptide repeat protein [Exilibacterium tricleocarpae]TQV74499.1 tetratricopeptide repeat protein [Exilibacterium tricleocarpae]